MSDHYENTRKYFDQMAVQHDGFYDTEPGKPAAHCKWQRLLRLVLRTTLDRLYRRYPAPQTLVDIGCGRGDITRDLARRYRGLSTLVGTDYAIRAAAIGPRINDDRRVSFAGADLRALPFPSRTIDWTICVNVMHHIRADDQRQAFAELARITRGFLIVELKNADNFYCRGTGRREHPMGAMDVYPISPQRVEAILGSRGLTLVDERSLIGFLPAFGPLRWALNRLSPLLVQVYRRA